MGSKVISFRFDDDKLALLQQHQVEGESENQTAMRLLLGVLGVEGKKPSLQSVDIVDDIRNEIKESLADGDIKEAIATSYEATMGQFNGLLEELQALQKQVQELQSNPLATVPSPPTEQESTGDNEPLPILEAIASVENITPEPINNNDQIKIEELKIEELNLPVYVHNALKRQQVNTVGELLKYSEADFLSIKGMGIKALSNLKEACQRYLGVKFPAPKTPLLKLISRGVFI